MSNIEIAVGVLIISGLLFCLLLWAEVIKLNLGKEEVKEEEL